MPFSNVSAIRGEALMKKITFIHTDFRLYWPARLAALGDFLEERGAELSVIEIAGKGSPYSFETAQFQPGRLDWQRLFPDEAMEGISPDKAVKGVTARLDEINPDVVFAGAIAFPSGAAAARWGAKHRKPVVIFDDARLEDVPRSQYVNWVKKQLYSMVDAMLIPAPSHASTFRFFGIDAGQLFYGINCVDNRYFAEQALLSPRFPMPLQKPFLIAAGRQVKKKNWTKLITAYLTALQTKPSNPLDLVFIGEGPEHPAMLKAAGNEVNRSIHFLPFKCQQDLCAFYAHAEGLILPSLYGETWGLVVNEAMASGLPVLVSSHCGCAATLVKDGTNGFVFDPEDEGSIADVLVKFMSMSAFLRKEMGLASKSIVACWDLERFCNGVWSAFEYVASKPKKRGSVAGRVISRFWNGRYMPL